MFTSPNGGSLPDGCASRQRRRDSSAAKCDQQFPPSDDDCHTPLPCEVRKGNDTTSRARSLAVQRGQDAGRFDLRLQLQLLPLALGERRHRGLALRLVAVSQHVSLRNPILVGWRALHLRDNSQTEDRTF